MNEIDPVAEMERIKAAAAALGMSQADVARAVHMPPSHVSDYWRGTRKLSLKTLNRFRLAIYTNNSGAPVEPPQDTELALVRKQRDALLAVYARMRRCHASSCHDCQTDMIATVCAVEGWQKRFNEPRAEGE